MEPWWLKHSGELSKGLFVVGFLVLGSWETLQQARVLKLPTAKRWLLHAFLLILVGVCTSLLFRVSALALSVAVSESSYGLLNRASLGFPLQFSLTFVLLDLVQYTTHYLRHSVPLLWRFHQLHHSDRDLDLSTGVRFHPMEVLFAHSTHLLAIAVLAPPTSALLCFELCGILQAFFSHANLSLPPRFEKVLRWIQVTPEMHRIHHSQDAIEQRSNLGVTFSIWDRLFRTYQCAPNSGADQLAFGVKEVSAAQSLRPLALLALPFVPRPKDGSHPGFVARWIT